MCTNSGTWLFAHDRWIFVLDRHPHYNHRPENNQHGFHPSFHQNLGYMQVPYQLPLQRAVMDKDNLFQPLREEIDFMNAPFLSGNIIEPPFSTGRPSVTSQESGVNNSTPCSTPPSEDLEVSLQEASLLHPRTDEQMAPHMPIPHTIYLNPTVLTLWEQGPVANTLPGDHHNPAPCGPTDSLSGHAPSATDQPVAAQQRSSIPPWRDPIHELSSTDPRPTMSPAQLGPVLQPTSIGPGVSYDGYEDKELSTISENTLPAAADPQSTGDSQAESEASDDSSSTARRRGRQHRKGLPCSRPLSCSPQNINITASSNTSRSKYRAFNSKTSSAPKDTTTRNSGRSFPLATGQERVARDEFLLRCRAAGMSYRQLKEFGNLPEAESTLRGRFRTLTKSKKERVRRPVWTDRDVSLPDTPFPLASRV